MGRNRNRNNTPIRQQSADDTATPADLVEGANNEEANVNDPIQSTDDQTDQQSDTTQELNGTDSSPVEQSEQNVTAPAGRGESPVFRHIDELAFVKEEPVPVSTTSLSRTAMNVAGLLQQYETAMSPEVLNDRQLSAGAKLLSRAVDAMSLKPEDTDALELFWQFCRQHAGDLMSERKAMRGTASLAAEQHNRTAMMVALFRDSATGRVSGGAQGAVIEQLKKLFHGKADILIFIQSKG